MKSKAALSASRIFAWLRILIGFAFSFFISLTLSATQSLVDETGKPVMDPSIRTLMIYLVYVGVILIISGIITVRRISRFNRYVPIIFQMKISSISEIARQMSQKHKYTAKDLAKMIRKRYFTNAYINVVADKIIIRRPGQHPAVSQSEYHESQVISESYTYVAPIQVIQTVQQETAAPTPNTAPVQNSTPAPPAKPAPVTCSGCGAVNSVMGGQNIHCEYCGSLLP